MKKVLITGISGQDGSYLSELLLSKGYEVHGTIRRVALEDETHRLWRLRKIRANIILHSASLESFASLSKVINKVKPDEIYHLAAQSYVHNSFEDEFSTLNCNINGTHYILSALRDINPDTKFLAFAKFLLYFLLNVAFLIKSSPLTDAYGICGILRYGAK